MPDLKSNGQGGVAMLTRLQIALLMSSLALLLTVIVGFYFGTFASGSPRYFFVWLAALALTVPALSFARLLTMRKKSRQGVGSG
jgi:hypothetical protein